MKLLLIKWEDAYGVSPSWQPLEGIKEPAHLVATSVGFEAYRDDKVLVLLPHTTAETDNCEAQGCGDMTIPVSAIVSEEVLVIECTGVSTITPPDTSRDIMLALRCGARVRGYHGPHSRKYYTRCKYVRVTLDQSTVVSWEELE